MKFGSPKPIILCYGTAMGLYIVASIFFVIGLILTLCCQAVGFIISFALMRVVVFICVPLMVHHLNRSRNLI